MKSRSIITLTERIARKNKTVDIREKTNGLGERVQKVIHAGLDAIPMNPATRNAIKQCGGCAKRKAMLNQAGEAVGQLFNKTRNKLTIESSSLNLKDPESNVPPPITPNKDRLQ